MFEGQVESIPIRRLREALARRHRDVVFDSKDQLKSTHNK